MAKKTPTTAKATKKPANKTGKAPSPSPASTSETAAPVDTAPAETGTPAEAPSKKGKAPAPVPAGLVIERPAGVPDDAIPLLVKSGKSEKSNIYAWSFVLPPSDIHVQSGFNSRTSLPNLDAMEHSIRTNGLINPLTVRRVKGKGPFTIIAGECRKTVLTDRLKWSHIPVLYRPDADHDNSVARALNLAENSDEARKGMNDLDLAKGFQDLSKDGWSAPRIAAETGYEAHTVRRIMKLLEVPKAIQAKVASGEMNAAQAQVIAGVNPALQKEALQIEGLAEKSAADIKSILAKKASEMTGGKKPSGPANNKKGVAKTAALRIWRPGKAKNEMLAEIASRILGASKEEQDTALYHQFLGAMAYGLWDRGEMDKPRVPDAETEKEDYAAFMEKVTEAAQSHKSESPKPDAPVGDTDGDGETDGDTDGDGDTGGDDTDN